MQLRLAAAQKPTGAGQRPVGAGPSQRLGPGGSPSPSLREIWRVEGDRHISGLGFRFGPGTDVDGDGVQDVAAGARWTDFGAGDMGYAEVWSGVDGELIQRWEGDNVDALFGHQVLLGPDVDRDGLADAVADDGAGDVFVVSGADGSVIWQWTGEQERELYGRMVSWAGDLDLDGVPDVAMGAPQRGLRGELAARPEGSGRFEVRSGRTGQVLYREDGTQVTEGLGWHITPAQRLGPDGVPGLLVSALWWETPPDLLNLGQVRAYIYQ